MKNNFKNIALVFMIMQASFLQAQHYFSFTGKVYDSTEMNPLKNYPVLILAKDMSFFKITRTNDDGIYSDSVFTTANQSTYVSVTDCRGVDHVVNFPELEQVNEADFNICGGINDCQAFFDFKQDSSDFKKFYFTNLSTGNYNKIVWDFGDGNFSDEPDPVHRYIEEGVYFATLQVFNTNDSLCYSTYSELIYAVDQEVCQADFSYALESYNNEEFTYQFTDLSECNADFWIWEFGDGEISFDQNPVHTYLRPGIYFVSLYVQDSLGFEIGYKTNMIVTPQNYVFDGTVYDSLLQTPLPDHPVHISYLDTTKEIVTDEKGQYSDTLLLTHFDSVRVSVFDCNANEICHTFKILEPVNRFDFHICVTHENCNADFSFYLDSLSITPNRYLFTDLSEGDAGSRLWNFGDSTTSQEQNPIHIYEKKGTYQVSLVVTSSSGTCSDSSIKTISTPDYYNFGGQVFLDNFPINIEPGDSSNIATAYLYRSMNNRWILMEQKDFWELGYYWFLHKLEGKYIIRIDLKNNSEDFGHYAPSYYVNALNWSKANILILNDSSYQESIWLTPLKVLDPGAGSISGYLKEVSRDSLNLNRVLIQLFDHNDEIVKYTYTDETGSFYFDQLPAGNYFIVPELAGYCYMNEGVTITESNPNIFDLETVIYDCQPTGINSLSTKSLTFKIFPIPATDHINIKNENGTLSDVQIEIFNSTGQRTINKNIQHQNKNSTVTINTSILSNGIYLLRIHSNNLFFTKKLIINH